MLSIIGAVFHLIGGLTFVFFGALFAFVGFGAIVPGAPPGSQEFLAGLGILFVVAAVVFIVLAFLGAIWMYSGQKRKTTWGGILTLIIAIVAVPTLWGVFIGSLLGFIGAILALVWTPTPAMPAPVPAPAAMPPPATPAPEPSPMPAPEPEESSDEPSTEAKEP